MNFTPHILNWYKNNHRDLPWRDTNDPYKIWLSEIILQQTRVLQGMDYYFRFIDKFPNVRNLALASEDEVLATWQGLGYYSRARNLHHTAKVVWNKFGGSFPADYHQLLQLKGIGNYTAAAIASIAFQLPFAAVDGNVTRVIARVYGIQDPVDNPKIKKNIEVIANELIDPNHPGDFNQAMMDFGSMICKPSNPDCPKCPFAQDCVARNEGLINFIPLKIKKTRQKNRYFHFFLFYCPQDYPIVFFMEKREDMDIWKNLYQLPMLETKSAELESDLIKGSDFLNIMPFESLPSQINGVPITYKHQLTHQRIEAFFYKIPLARQYCPIFEKAFMKVRFDDFEQLGKPVLITKYLEKIKNDISP